MREANVGKTLGILLPERIALVVCPGRKGRPNVMPAGWYTRVSFAPPMVAVSIARANFTNPLLRKSRDFVIAFASPKLKRIIMPTGSTSGRNTDKFAKFRIKAAKASRVKTPLLAEAEVNLECRKVSSHQAGDHTIFVGRVVAAHRGGYGRMVIIGADGKLRSSPVKRS